MRWTTVKNKTSIIWNGISKGKYKLSFLLWVGMWVRKKKLKDTYTKIHRQSVGSQKNRQYMYVYKNIWNGISKGKYDSLLELWTGEWMVNKFIYTYTITMI